MNAQRIQELDRIENELSDRLIPARGKADTVGGELLRAIERLIYRYYNDGDVVLMGYGIETCLSSYYYLEDTLIELGVISICTTSLGHVQWSKPECDPDAAANHETKFDYSENDKYQDALYNLLALVIDFINNDERAKQPNEKNSRSYREDEVMEAARQYELEYDDYEEDEWDEEEEEEEMR